MKSASLLYRHTAVPVVVAMLVGLVAPVAMAQDGPEMQISVVESNEDKGIKRPEAVDAPKEDFEKVAWCHGILSGHMALAEMVAPVSPPSPEMKAIGSAYLRSYEAALTLSGKGKDEASYQKAEAARQAGYDAWKPSMEAEPTTAAWLYDNWSLPGDCEKAAVAISGRPNLFAEMATDEEAEIIHRTLTSSGVQSVGEIAAPRIVARTVNQDDPDAPISTNRTYRQPASGE